MSLLRRINNAAGRLARIIVPIIVGAMFIFGGIALVNAKNPDFIDTKVTVTSIETQYIGVGEDTSFEYRVEVRYDVDGKTYNSLYDSYAANYKVGDELPAKYNPENPEEIQSTGGFFPYLFIIIGAVSALIGIAGIFRRR